MSPTRDVWKPLRANTRTAASRMTRRFSSAAALRSAKQTQGSGRFVRECNGRSAGCSLSTSPATCRVRSRPRSCCAWARGSCASSSRAATRCARPPRVVARRPQRRQGVGRQRPARRRRLRARPARAGRRRPRVVPSGRGGASRHRPRRCTRDDGVLLDHRLRRDRPARTASRARPELRRLVRRARADTRRRCRRCRSPTSPRARSAPSPRSSPRSLERERTGRGARARRLDDARRAPARLARAGAHERLRLLPHVRDRRRQAPHRRRPRAEVLRAPVRAARPSRARLAAVRRRPGGARRGARRVFRAAGRWKSGCTCSTHEDVCVGPVATLAEAAADLGVPPPGRAAALGEHTAGWRRELGL